MLRVICTLPNAGSAINGVTFEPGPEGLVSRALTTEEAARFGVIPGYRLVRTDPPAAAPEPKRVTRKPSNEA